MQDYRLDCDSVSIRDCQDCQLMEKDPEYGGRPQWWGMIRFSLQFQVTAYHLGKSRQELEAGTRRQAYLLLHTALAATRDPGGREGGVHMVLAFLEENCVSIILSEPASCA